MIERTSPPSSGRIQKTTSRIALIGLATATMMITVSMIGVIQLQQASAAKPDQFCFDPAFNGLLCFDTMKDCQQAQKAALDIGVVLTERCHPVRLA